MVYIVNILKILKDIQIEIDNAVLKDALKEMMLVGKIDTISYYVADILKKSDNRIFMKFDDKYVQLIYYTLLHSNPNFKLYNEYPCSNGYIDLMLFSNHEICKYDMMIEYLGIV